MPKYETFRLKSFPKKSHILALDCSTYILSQDATFKFATWVNFEFHDNLSSMCY